MIFLIKASSEIHGSGDAIGTETTAGSAPKSLLPLDTSIQKGSSNGDIDISGASLPGGVGERNREDARKFGSGKYVDGGSNGGGGSTCASSEAAVTRKRKASEYGSNSKG